MIYGQRPSVLARSLGLPIALRQAVRSDPVACPHHILRMAHMAHWTLRNRDRVAGEFYRKAWSMPAARPPKPAEGKRSAALLRKLARAHTEAAVQVLAEVAANGNSEASRISAAMALLDRGYGKSSTATSDAGARAPTLYQRIELVDGTKEKSEDGQPTGDDQG